MKKLMMLTVFVVMAAFAGQARAADVKIKDMDPSHWAYKSIQMLVEKGYIALYNDNTFKADQAVSREVFAAALAKLIDQIENGELNVGATDMKEIKKLGEEFSGDMADSDARMGKLEKRLSDIESGKVVLQIDITKINAELRDKYEELLAENEKMKKDLAMLTDQMAALSDGLKTEEKKRKKSSSSLWLGVLAAMAVGAAVN
jgi:hypothetical protein